MRASGNVASWLVSSVVSAFSHRASNQQVPSVWLRQQQFLGDSSRSQSYEARGADIANMCLLHTLHSDNIEWR